MNGVLGGFAYISAFKKNPMTRTISFISRKGGTGKTTNAINFANVLCERGYHVVVFETDINYTLSALRSRERRKVAEGKRIPDLVRTEETSIVKMIKTFQNDGVTDYIIVDTAAGNTTSYCTNRLCVLSDMVIVPTSLSINDVLVTEQTLNDILPAKKENPDLKVFLLPNRVHSLTSDETIQRTLGPLKVPILNIFIPNKKIYTHPSTVRAPQGYIDVLNVVLKELDEPMEEPVNKEEQKTVEEHEVFNEKGMPLNETMNNHEMEEDESPQIPSEPVDEEVANKFMRR